MPALTNLNDERLIKEGETAVDQYNRSRDHARKQIMPMALGLLAARRAYPADRDFGDWLHTSSYREIEHQDRAALIKIGEHEPFASKFIRTTSLISPQTIWAAIQELIPVYYDSKPTADLLVFPQNDAAPSSQPLAQDSASGIGQEFHTQAYAVTGLANKSTKSAEKAELVKVLGIMPDDYLTLFSAYPDNRQRALRKELLRAKANTKKGGGKTAIKLFQFALDIVRSGDAAQINEGKEFDARIFMPKLPAGIAKTISFDQIRDRYDRLQLMNVRCLELEATKASAFETHSELNHLWQTGTNLPTKAVVISVSDDDSKSRIKHEVKFCGELIWPRESLRHVTYEDLNTGWHLTHYWLNHLEHATPQKPRETAVQIRHLMWDIREASSIAGLVDVMMACLAAFSKRNNDGKAQADLSGCIPPGRAR